MSNEIGFGNVLLQSNAGNSFATLYILGLLNQTCLKTNIIVLCSYMRSILIFPTWI